MPHIVDESVYLREYRMEDLEEIHKLADPRSLSGLPDPNRVSR